MEILIILAILTIISIAACKWTAQSHKRDVRNKQSAKVIKMEKRLRKSLDIKLSPDEDILKQMDEAIAATSSFS